MEKKEFVSKQELRSRYLNYRNQLSMRERREKSARIWEFLKAEKIYQNAENLLVYMDYRSEVMTCGVVEELLKEHKKRIFAPKVEGMDIRFYEVTGMEDFADGYQGIREPEGDENRLFTEQMAKTQKCLLLVPGSVFDRERGRMGYGKGFYDRYLDAFPDLKSAALAFECQIAKKVPIEAHDRKPDMIVTDKGIIR
ncbi:MAG: 5-formyltetrahydrofolate cyclo-ligase [Lachnospiraceae bacterium]|nr:5-formyltetrahydrofolate cyclo-ligase [Lachnospiraceae bacterium]MDE6185934.1 5-formyltetrahydrofolate cyclo-ligase [Lachnospiraceae bacterium]